MTSRKMSQQQTSNETLSSRRDTESHRQLSVPGRVISASAPAAAAFGAPPGPGPRAVRLVGRKVRLVHLRVGQIG